MSTVPAPVAAIVRERSGRVCEVCGKRSATEMHHRQYRSRGGRDVASNLLHVCGWGNHTGCHGAAHTGAGEALGLSVRSGFDPAAMPVLRPGVGMVLLDDDGGWAPAERVGLGKTWTAAAVDETRKEAWT